MANAESETLRRQLWPLSSVVALLLGFCVFGALFVTNSVIHGSKRQMQSEFGYRRTKCDPEICGQQCYSRNYMNAWCENFTCYCDNDCLRHRNLYPWDDTTRTCADICELKHGPCTGSGCAEDTYWANSTRAEYELYHKVSLLFEPKVIRHVSQYYFYNSTACFCNDNETEHKNEVTTTSTPTALNNSQPEWKFWLSLNPIKSQEDSDENKYGVPRPKPPKYKMWNRSNSRSEVHSSESDERPSCETGKASGSDSAPSAKLDRQRFHGKKPSRKMHRSRKRKGQKFSNSRSSSGSRSTVSRTRKQASRKERRNRKPRPRRRW